MLHYCRAYATASRWLSPIIALALLPFLPPSLLAQTTIATGSIVGTVTDPSGAVIVGAQVSVSNDSTGQEIHVTTNSAGTYNSGALIAGDYTLRISAKGFSTVMSRITVLIGNTTSGDARLPLGTGAEVIDVTSTAVQVNTEQATVQGVLTSAQIENLPVNGRNFLDLAQLEPGVQIQDGQNFDPTKAGYSSISFGGRFGRTARINVDGVDDSDETLGTTTAYVPASAIAEFQLSQSSLDLSNDLTSSGAVNVATRSGTNSFHGEGFGLIRDHSFAAAQPGGQDLYSQRSQFGGRFGGPLIKNKFFFFLDGERTKQDSAAPVILAGTPFVGFGGSFGSPFRENNVLAKADYALGGSAKAFYKYSYFSNSLFATFGLGYSVYDNKDVTRQHVVGLDWSTGTLSHSIRFTYLKFQNQIVDATLGDNSLPLCCTGLELSSSSFFVGPNLLAPQSTPQSNHQIKYDGGKSIRSHTLRYGVAFNHIQGGGFADFYGTAPRVSWSAGTDPVGSLPGGAANPLNYPVQRLRVGNGQGFNTLDPALGFPAGGLGPDNRLGLYAGDSWKIKPNFTLSFGLRHDRDTGRTDSDLPPDPSINAVFPGFGNRVKQANTNFAPQLGFAWDPKNNGKTVIRGGIGLFYENVIWNNVLFDRPLRLQTGAFNAVTSACLRGLPQPVPVGTSFDPSGFISPVPPYTPFNLCNQPVGAEIPEILAFWQKVLAGNPLDLKAPNPNYIGNFLAAGQGSGGNVGLFAPNYKSPRSVQMNIGIQREIRHDLVLTADFLRNVETRSLLSLDLNRDGDVSTFNLGGAQQAISDTNNAFKCGTGFDSASIDCAISGVNNGGTGATMTDYAGVGLGASADLGVGCNQDPTLLGLGHPCAFGGTNRNQASFFMLQPVGRSVHNALQMKLSQNMTNPFRGVKAVNFQVSYSLSRFS